MSVYDVSSIKDRIFGNSYVGRSIIIGKTPDGKKAAMAYFIMGRSENSRNRVFALEDGRLYTKAFDETKVKNPSLIIYNAVRRLGDNLIVTNGEQTDTIFSYIKSGKSFEEALNMWDFEPDPPIFTPRISGMLTFSAGDFTYKMNILKSADAEGSACVRENFAFPALKGVGHFLHTYKSDGAPVPSFTGEPERVSVPGDIDDFTREIWDNLNADNRVSLYTRCIDLSTLEYEERLINRNK